MIWLFDKLKYFPAGKRTFLVSTVTETAFKALTQTQQNHVVSLFSMIDEDTTEAMMETLVLFLRDLFLLQTGPFVFIVNEGENFSLDLEASSSWVGYKLVAREHFTNELLTDPSLDGTADQIQTLQFTDLPLSAGNFYLLRCQLEHATANEANGEAVSLLAKVYLIVDLKVDV